MSIVNTLKNVATGPGIEFVSISNELFRFRCKLENEAEKPIHELEVNAAMLLSDLAEHLKLGAAQHDSILGQPAVDFIAALMSERVRLKQ